MDVFQHELFELENKDSSLIWQLMKHTWFTDEENIYVCVFLCTELKRIIHNYFMLCFNCFPFLAIRCSWSEVVGKLQQLFAAWVHNNSNQTQHKTNKHVNSLKLPPPFYNSPHTHFSLTYHIPSLLLHLFKYYEFKLQLAILKLVQTVQLILSNLSYRSQKHSSAVPKPSVPAA